MSSDILDGVLAVTDGPQAGGAVRRSETKRSETKRNEARPGDPAAVAAEMPAAGRCKRAGCRTPLPAQDSGRSRQFCSDECRRRHYNALRAAAPAAPAPPGQAGAALARLSQLLAEAGRLAAQAERQVADAAPEHVAALAAEAEAARRAAEARAAVAEAQARESAESATAAQ
jgi:hypothetical protein